MKIYLKVKKDNAYQVTSLWSKFIKEQILETVKEVSQNWMFEGAPDKPCGEAVQTLTQNCCQTIHEEWYVFDSFHLCTEAFDL